MKRLLKIRQTVHDHRKENAMARWIAYLLISCLVLPVALTAKPLAVESAAFPLEACAVGAFSTEEDFMMTEGEPYDGDPYISDGDILSRDGKLCARNKDLVQPFSDQRMPDLGLDALDILDITDRIVAFSTEIDDPGGSFSAGDLLLTTGAVIPNLTLVHKFNISADVGLDAVALHPDLRRR